MRGRSDTHTASRVSDDGTTGRRPEDVAAGRLPGVRAWRVHRSGRPSEALELDEVSDPVPARGEVLVRTTASVLNYNEVDACYGRYLTVNPPLPYTLGMELTGVVEATGPGEESWL